MFKSYFQCKCNLLNDHADLGGGVHVLKKTPPWCHKRLFTKRISLTKLRTLMKSETLSCHALHGFLISSLMSFLLYSLVEQGDGEEHRNDDIIVAGKIVVEY